MKKSLIMLLLGSLLLTGCDSKDRALYEKYLENGGTKTYAEWKNGTDDSTKNSNVNSISSTKNSNLSQVDANPITKTLRTNEARITDSGRANQQVDICYLSYDLNGLVAAGYIYLKIEITLEAREYDDGYQYLFLYNSSSCQGTIESTIIGDIIPGMTDTISDGLLWSTKFELTSGSKQTSWKDRNFSFYIKTSNVKDNLWLRYGASGDWEDDWGNRNVQITVTPSKNTIS